MGKIKKFRVSFQGFINTLFEFLKLKLRVWINNNRSWVQFLARLYPIIIGIWIAIDSDKIQSSTRCFFNSIFGSCLFSDIDVSTLVFWILLVIWAIVMYLLVWDEHIESKQRIDSLGEMLVRQEETLKNQTKSFEEQEKTLVTLTGTLYGVNNPYLITEYPSILEVVRIQASNLNKVDVNVLNKTDRDLHKAHLNEILRDVFQSIIEMTNYASDSQEEDFGINAMLFVEADGEVEYLKFLRKKTEFFKEWSEEMFLGYLFLETDSSIMNRTNGSIKCEYENVVLPVPRQMMSENGVKRALPGAPTACFSFNGYQIIYDVDMLPQIMAKDGVDGEVIKRLNNYILNEITGFKSFFSKKVSWDGDLVGVINVDSSKIDIIGRESAPKDKFFKLFSNVVSYTEYILYELSRIKTLELKEEFAKLKKYGSNTGA
ncbi:hypothetical protein [uncultured Roseivirga sp.]|uniref:hypothetical protein n=1 Tax=uncultured Roseivirga sp. TaxID=543088 RepID=UPI0030D873DE|tara:strand:- start:56153 stop:57442 length:1290 start_codon:yes stop_codon:yes gene_type:complete